MTEALASMMSHPDVDLRVQAALALGTQRSPAAVEALLASLDDADVNVRFHVIEALGRQASPAATERLAAIAVSAEFFLAFAAIEALLQIGDPLVATRIVPLLDNQMLSGIAAEALGAIGDEDVVAPLLESLGAGISPVESTVQAWPAFTSDADVFSGSEIRSGRRVSAATGGSSRHARATGERLAPVTVLGWLKDPRSQHWPGCSGQRRPARSDRGARRFGPSAVPLIDQLDVDDAGALRSAVVALGRQGDTRATRG